MRSAEAGLLLAALILSGVIGVTRPHDGRNRTILTAIGCYLGIGIALLVSPRRTGPHHWVLGTPFQYVAIGFALEAARQRFLPARSGAAWRAYAAPGLRVVVAALLLVRVAGLISVERALWRGDSGPWWSPELTQLGRFAAARAGKAVFIAADWGVATQIYCLSNGRDQLVYEPFWSYEGPAQLQRLQQESGTDVLYALSLNPPKVRVATAERIFRDLASSPYWQETDIDAEAAHWHAVTIRKFIHAPRTVPTASDARRSSRPPRA
jgi:hypothetical protein